MATLGSAPGIMLGVGVGTAAAAALEPLIEPGRQQAWKDHPNRVLDPETMARLVAQGGVAIGDAIEAGAREGFREDKVRALAYMAQTVPGIGESLRILRRDPGFASLFNHALVKHGLDTRYFDGIRDLQHNRLEVADLARAIHRGLIPDPGLLQGELPTREGNVAAYPVYDINALDEARADGYDRARLGVQVGLQGNPMGPHEAALAQFRGILTEDDYLRAIAEGNTRNEWAKPIREQTRQIPTARDFLENALRGYRNLPEAIRGAALHGMSPEHATMIYQNQGRPMNVRLITQALARGGKFQPEPGEIKDPYRAAIVEGNLKPAYYDLADSLKYTMPSPFAIRQLVTTGVWSAEKGAERLKWLGWFPDDADEVAAAWAGGGGTSADPHIARAQTQLWGTTHRSYIAAEITATVARNRLQQLGVAPAARTTIMGLWDAERELVRKQLTPAKIKKAFAKATKNYATGAAWTRDDAIAALVSRGYSVNEANDFLDIPSGN